MRLLLVIDSLDVGGAERYAVDLARALRTRHEVTVACSTAGPFACELEGMGVAVRPLARSLVKRRFSGAYATAIAALLDAEPFDLVHAHLYASEVAVAVATLGRGVPVVLTDHTEGPWRGEREEALSRWTYGRAQRLMAVSRAIRRHLIEHFGVPAERVTYVPNAVVASNGRPNGAAPDGRLTVGRVARLAPEKGIDVFLRAVAYLQPRFPGVDFVVIGDGPLRDELPAVADRLGVGERVRFLGLRRDARTLIEHLDVLAVSSITDGAPLVVLEAMGAGVPVVGSAVGGIPDQVRHGEEGLLVPPGDAEALADALGAVIGDRALRRRLGASARRRVEDEFGYDAFVARVEGVYAAAIA